MKCIVLVSGGLDSVLALKLIADQGIEVIPLYFSSPFGGREDAKSSNRWASIAAGRVDAKLRTVYIGEPFLDIVKNPRFGLGKNVNPCIDCRIQRLMCAKDIMLSEKASFVVTGEVLGQRPMSQHKNAMNRIEKHSGLEGLILRPLSAKLLKPTVPEIEGWVDRDSLKDFHGRSRKPQMRLAEELGIDEYPGPAGGCLLTDPNFARRVNDLIDHDMWDLDNVNTLRIGRHFRLNPSFKLIVGREEKENDKLLSMALPGDAVFDPGESKGPTCLGKGDMDKETMKIAASIEARYIVADRDEIRVSIRHADGSGQMSITTRKIDEEEFNKYII